MEANCEDEIFYSDEEFSDSEEGCQMPSVFGVQAFGATTYTYRPPTFSYGVPTSTSTLYTDRTSTSSANGVTTSTMFKATCPTYMWQPPTSPVSIPPPSATSPPIPASSTPSPKPTTTTRTTSTTRPSTISYSAAASKPAVPQARPAPKAPPRVAARPREVEVVGKAAVTATMAGYQFLPTNPQPDPRYPVELQVVVGPIPGSLPHDTLYPDLFCALKAAGHLVTMYLQKNPMRVKNELVKFGYAVFSEARVAGKVVRKGSVTLPSNLAVTLRPMKA